MFQRRIFKGAVSILLVCVFLFPTMNAFASEGLAIEKALLSRGYPWQVLNALSDQAMEKLYQTGSTFDHATLQYYDPETGETTNRELTAGQQAPATRGQIQEKHLELLWLMGSNPDKSKNISFHYTWKALPLNRWQDPVAISWDKDKFYLKTGSFEKVDYYTMRQNGASELYLCVQSEEHTYSNGGADSVTWYADLKGHSPYYAVYDLFGYAFITLVPKTSSGQSQLFGHYVHAKRSPSLSISIPKLGSFSVSGGVSYDDIGTQTDIAW